MKRLVSIAAAISTVLLGTAVSAQTYISGGGIEIGGNVNTAREGDIVTISVFKDGAEWESEEFWTGENSDKIVFIFDFFGCNLYGFFNYQENYFEYAEKP